MTVHDPGHGCAVCDSCRAHRAWHEFQTSWAREQVAGALGGRRLAAHALLRHACEHHGVDRGQVALAAVDSARAAGARPDELAWVRDRMQISTRALVALLRATGAGGDRTIDTLLAKAGIPSAERARAFAASRPAQPSVPYPVVQDADVPLIADPPPLHPRPVGPAT